MNGFPYRRGEPVSLTAAPDREGVSIVGITGQAAHADHQPFLVHGRDGDFHPKLVGMTRLAFAYAFDF